MSRFKYLYFWYKRTSYNKGFPRQILLLRSKYTQLVESAGNSVIVVSAVYIAIMSYLCIFSQISEGNDIMVVAIYISGN